MAENRRPLRSHYKTKPASSSTEDMGVADLAILMKSQFATCQQTTTEEIQQLGNTFHTNMDNLRSDLEIIRNESNQTKNEILRTVEANKVECLAALDRMTRASDLIVSGVPFVEGENLKKYFDVWCRLVGYTDKYETIPLVNVKRLVKDKPEKEKVYPISIQFAIYIQRVNFYKLYLSSRKLSLTDIGLAPDQRVYINESLDPATRALRASALQMKKAGHLAKVYTRLGIVYVKKSADSQEMQILSENDLNALSQKKVESE